jgi:ribosomal protein L16 Arg81 hydroxylase
MVMFNFLSLFNPYRWLAYMAGAAALVGLFWYAVHSYNVSITEEAVNAALVKERTITAPAIKELVQRIADRDLTIATMKAESDAERTRQQAKLNTKTIEYKNAMLKTKTIQAKYDTLLGTSADFERMLHAATANNDSAGGAGLSPRFKQLSAAHQQCERDLRSSIEQTIATTGELSKAVAVIEALKQ